MRLANGIVLDKEKTFGVLKFSALRHEVRVENEDGTTSEEIKRRTYDLKCSQQERTIQVSIPAEIPVKDYPYNAEVELINPVADTVANANYRGADVEWYIKADDIVLKNKGGQPANIVNIIFTKNVNLKITRNVNLLLPVLLTYVYLFRPFLVFQHIHKILGSI